MSHLGWHESQRSSDWFSLTKNGFMVLVERYSGRLSLARVGGGPILARGQIDSTDDEFMALQAAEFAEESLKSDLQRLAEACATEKRGSK